jgi:3-oxoadipate enol-lactonase
MDTRTVAVADVDLVIAEAGVGGRPLLLLHGFTGAKEDFTEWLDRLALAGWHAVAPDHRGHGASSKPPADDAYSLRILGDDAVKLTEALGWSEFGLLGHSMGGFVAQEVAAAVADRLTALVLMDTSFAAIDGIDPDEAAVAIAIARERGMDTLADLLAARESPLDTAAHRRVMAEREGYGEFNQQKLRATSPHLYAAIVPELIGQSDMLDRLAALSPVPPTLVIVGEQDAPFLGPSEAMAKAIPGAALVVIPDAGHSPQFENPKGWWEALSGFLATV